MRISEQDYLAHYGVKGMKWGVRRYQPYPSGNRRRRAKHPSSVLSTNPSGITGRATYKFLNRGSSKTSNKGSSPTTSPLQNTITSPFKKTAMMRAAGVGFVDSVAGNKFVMPKLGGKDDIMFRKGSIVQHVMTTRDKDLNRHLFVAADKADKANYAGFFAALTKYRNNADMMYRMELKAKETLVSPGKQKRVEEFLKLYEEDKVNISRELAEFNKREYGGYFKKDTDYYAKQYENMSMKELKSNGYYTFFNSLFSSDYNREKYFSRLKEQGYNSVVDDNDKRSFMQAKAPLIVFNAQESLAKKKVSELPMEEIQQNMIKWSRMLHMDTDGDILMHYGVKGMKWGVRRYEDDRVRRARAQYKKAMRTKTSQDQRTYLKRELDDAVDRSKMDARRTVSDREKELAVLYQKEGLTKSEAELAAFKRARTEKALKILGGVAVGAAAVYLARRGYVRNFDTIIKAGTKIQNLNTHNPKAVADVFYGAINKGDMAKYKGLYGKALRNGPFGAGERPVFKTMLETTSDIKVASPKTGRKVIADLMKNYNIKPKNQAEYEAQQKSVDYVRQLINDLDKFTGAPKQQRVIAKAKRDLAKGKVTRAVYDAQNAALMNGLKSKDTFTKALRDKGYGAVRDLNDMYYSGYKAKSPTVFFDKGKAVIKSASELPVKEINKHYRVEIGKMFSSSYAKEIAGGVIGGKAISLATQSSERKAVEKYRKEHPGTKKSYNEILKTLKR